MRFLTTGFTTKTWTQEINPESRGIKDLSLVLPEALIEMEHEVYSFKDMPEAQITKEDIIFVKLWDCFDAKYALHMPELIKKLSSFNVNTENIILISDHHDVRPALKSLERLAKISYMGKKLLKVYMQGKVLENRFQLQSGAVNYNNPSLDPSMYVIEDFYKSTLGQVDLDFKHWVYGSLTYVQPNNFINNYETNLEIDVHTELSSLQLSKEIARNRLYIMPEHSHNTSSWWRPNYLMGIAGKAAVYASKRDQYALFGSYFPMKFIENNINDVQHWQNDKLLKLLQSKENFRNSLNKYLRLMLPHLYS